MPLIRNTIIASCAAGLLSACSGTLLQAERATAPADPFARALHAGYTDLARAEQNENDFADADAFAARAIVASTGKPPAPENFGARQLPAEKLPELAAARDRLVTALNRGAAQSAPDHAARAQLAFDCWVQEQEENFQTTDIAACRDRFAAAIAFFDTKSLARATPQHPRATPANLKAPRGAAPLKTKFVIYFDLDAAALVPGAESEITRAAAAARRSGAAMVRVTGHADRSGAGGHNMKLSRTRAQEVVRALRRLGLPEIGVATQAFGEEKPAVPTGDGKTEPRNRRVEIELTH
jgi:outer membrane protein OmpA-like peptidoglycan-associated protein